MLLSCPSRSDDKVATVIHPELHFFRVCGIRPPSHTAAHPYVTLSFYLTAANHDGSIGRLILSELKPASTIYLLGDVLWCRRGTRNKFLEWDPAAIRGFDEIMLNYQSSRYEIDGEYSWMIIRRFDVSEFSFANLEDFLSILIWRLGVEFRLSSRSEKLPLLMERGHSL